MWLKCGMGNSFGRSKLSILLAKMTVAPGPPRVNCRGLIFCPSGVDSSAPERLYHARIRHAAASARRRVFEAPHRYSVIRLRLRSEAISFDGCVFA